MKRFKLCALILCIMLILSTAGGCWNYIDIETQFVVIGAIIDYDKDTEEYVIYAELSKARGGADTEHIMRIESFRGATLFDAIRNGIMKIGAKIYWGHMMIYVISESIARQGISEVMSLLSRQTQIRSDIFILVCDDDSVDKIFEFDDPIHDNISQHLYDLLETYEASGKFRRTPLYKILQELASEEISLMLPIINMEKNEEDEEGSEEKPEDESSTDEQGKESSAGETEDSKAAADEILIVSGSAIFSGDKMVSKLDEIQSRSALIIKSEVERNYVVTLKEQGEIPACSIEIINSDLKIEAIAENEKPLLLSIELKLEGDLVELQSLVDYISDEKKGELENAFEKLIESELIKVIKKAREYESDVFGFAGVTHRKEPGFWRANQQYWDDIFKSAQLRISVNVDITNSSLSMNPIKVGR